MLAYATLLQLQARYHDLLAIMADWLSARTQQHWSARRLLEADVWRHPQIEVRTGLAQLSDQTVWGLQVSTRDARVVGREWRLEATLRDLEQGGVQASVVVHALDTQRFGYERAAVPFSQPALVRTLLERGIPAADTPGLHPIPMETDTDVHRLVERIRAPNRTGSLVLLCRAETTLDVPALRDSLTGLADLIDLRPALPQQWVALLKPVSAWPPPDRAAFFPPRGVGEPSVRREPSLLLAAETRTLCAGVLKAGASRVLAQHLTLEQLQVAKTQDASGVVDV